VGTERGLSLVDSMRKEGLSLVELMKGKGLGLVNQYIKLFINHKYHLILD
jgi:hypothetical protein